MKTELIARLHLAFERLVRRAEETGTEFWLARDLQPLLGYDTWRRFEGVIQRAIIACRNSGYEPQDHFVGIGKMVDVGSGAQREIDDVALTRYACYLIAQNGDPTKEPIAFAQTYFAVHDQGQGFRERDHQFQRAKRGAAVGTANCPRAREE